MQEYLNKIERGYQSFFSGESDFDFCDIDLSDLDFVNFDITKEIPTNTTILRKA